MLIVNGMRRRTPGGVFFFLLKNCDEISKKQKADIFVEETRKTIKARKLSQALQRDQKVEELKKSLQCENDMPTLMARGDLLLASSTSHLRLDTHNTANLSNPPPSPVTDCNRENSSDFDTNDIQHMVNVTSPEKGIIPTVAILLHRLVHQNNFKSLQMFNTTGSRAQPSAMMMIY